MEGFGKVLGGYLGMLLGVHEIIKAIKNFINSLTTRVYVCFEYVRTGRNGRTDGRAGRDRTDRKNSFNHIDYIYIHICIIIIIYFFFFFFLLFNPF